MPKPSRCAVVPVLPVAILAVLFLAPVAEPARGQHDPCCRPVAPWLEFETRPGGGPGAAGSQSEDDEPTADESKDKDAADKPKWDVSKPIGPTTEIPIDTDEGTWLSVDVSPDGEHIIFDLLGDLYEIPIGGGDARALTSGLAWDMQARYSPDGRFIAFTSDRGGGDNIWVMKRDGSDIKQVTKESFRLLNSPAWAPDSEFIVAQKHFTSKRSLGSGEMWLYHRTGGDGLQMTKKPNDQKNVGEPVFSPDGKYLYFSLDATPGDTFEYDKDSNAGIYAINRLDREKGDIDRLIGGPGGACRPTPSPDGEWMAYVRRVRGQSVLYVQDLDSGQEWPLYHDLERDMQETWAVHGVYPTMAWTPDSKSIVFYAKGKIRRLTVESGDVTAVIPFRVKDTRKVQSAVRFPVEVAPADFEVKMLRWVSVSPDGRRVVFEALGKLYLRSLPEGEPQRLTRQDEHAELYPSWSPDSQSIVYTTWSDEALGEVRIVNAASPGGRGRTISDIPGHYVEPVFSPDGKTVVYCRVGGGYLRSRLWQRDQGVYRVDASGGEPKRITKKGEQPHFGADPDRVFLVQVSSEAGKDRRALTSINLDGAEERTHLFSENAVEYRVSPDGRWVGFVEGFNAYIAPFVPTGREVEIARKGKAMPQTRVSRDAGDNLHWSGDSTKLHWSLGPELFTRDVTESFTFLEGAPEQLPEPAATGVNISFRTDADVPEGVVAFTNARIITMRGDEVIESGTVVVEAQPHRRGGRVDRGECAEADAHVIDCTGLTIMPGLIDVHAHGAQGMDGIVPQRSWILRLARLRHDDGSRSIERHQELLRRQRAAARRAGRRPALYSTGTILYGAAGWFKAEIDSLEDASRTCGG
jgi:Tol biopolymer transport system component